MISGGGCRRGELIHQGRGFARNDAVAAQWYQKAADQGHAVALSNLGNLYENGQGVRRNYQKAIEFYKRAAG